MPLLLAKDTRLRGPGDLPIFGDCGTRRSGEGAVKELRMGDFISFAFKTLDFGFRWVPKTAEEPALGTDATP